MQRKMERRSNIPPSPLPQTPKRRSGAYQDLLQSFGSRSSATSVTKARRQSSKAAPERSQPATEESSKRALRSKPTRHYALAPSTPLESTVTDPIEDEPTETTAPNTSSALTSSETPSPVATESSADELALAPIERGVSKSHTSKVRKVENPEPGDDETLMMESHKRENGKRPRRSIRGKKGNILESDALLDELAATPHRRKPLPRAKPDTARQRLRDGIAMDSKAKANSFLVANKEYFLPLLPSNNHVSKLVANNDVAPIVEYEELTEQPRGVVATMKPYQLSGLSFLVHLYNNGFSGILGDEMGLGKTLQTLSLFQYLEEQDQKIGVPSEELRPYLVVCPLSVLNSWVNEAQRWVPNLKVLRIHGTVNERDRLKRVALGLEDMYGNETNQSKDRKASRKAGVKVSKLPTEDQGHNSYKIIVTTYETFQAEKSWFKHSFVWRYVVLDEGHKIKNNMTNVSSALKGVSSEFRLILTGTPLQNNLIEMWGLLAWLYPDVFTENTAALFKESFDLSKGKVNKQTMDDARRLLELIMLRRMKDSAGVDLNLPPKEEVLLYVPLTPMQRFWYERMLTRVGDALLDDLFKNVQSKEKDALEKEKDEDKLWEQVEKIGNGTDVDVKGLEWQETTDIMRKALQKEENTGARSAWQKLMNLVLQLRKCCSHPYLMPTAMPDPYYLGEHIIRASGKFIVLEKLLKNSVFNQGKKVLIFSGFTRTLDLCEDLLTLIGNHGNGFKYLRLDGGTTSAWRNLGIRLFNNPNSDYKVMLLSTRAGGLGINLTSAEDVIFLDEDWNPQITLQAEARAHRIGQTKKVTIYKLCTQGTVEEQMMGRIRKKLYLSAKITESMQSVHGHSASSKAKGGTSVTDDVPQMDTSQLKTLVRRGAQTLSHPEINVTDMLSWDLDTMLQKCCDKPSEALAADVDEEKWLSVMERVECAVFDGKKYQRQLKTASGAANILPDSISREDRRKGKNVTVMVDGFAISKESLNCADWEAVPTYAGKDPRLATPKREKAAPIQHEEHCLVCFDHGKLTNCKSCPRAYHLECLEPEVSNRISFGGFHCPQHQCFECGKNTSDAGGLIFRCRWCEHGYCEECLQWGSEDLIGGNLPEFEMLGHEPKNAYFIKCPTCKDTDEERKDWMGAMEQSYGEQHDAWIRNRDEELERFEKEREKEREQEELRIRDEQKYEEESRPLSRKRRNGQVPHSGKEPIWAYHNGGFDPLADYEAPSPPGLTDTSLPTPVPGGSGVSTPKLASNTARNRDGSKKKPIFVSDDEFYPGLDTRQEKRRRLDEQVWDVDTDSDMTYEPVTGSLRKRQARAATYRSSRRKSGVSHHP